MSFVVCWAADWTAHASESRNCSKSKAGQRGFPKDLQLEDAVNTALDQPHLWQQGLKFPTQDSCKNLPFGDRSQIKTTTIWSKKALYALQSHSHSESYVTVLACMTLAVQHHARGKPPLCKPNTQEGKTSEQLVPKCDFCFDLRSPASSTVRNTRDWSTAGFHLEQQDTIRRETAHSAPGRFKCSVQM